MAKPKKDWKNGALAAIKKVYPNASDRTIKNLLANMAHETMNGSKSTEMASKWKQIGDPKNNWKTIRKNVNSYMEKNNLSKDEYDALPAYKRISIQYSGGTDKVLSGGVGALHTTDVGGDKIKEMRAVGRELGLKNDKAILRYVNRNMYNSALFSLSVLKKQGHTSEELNSHVSALDLRKKIINPGETNAKRLASVANYEKNINTNFSNLTPEVPSGVRDFDEISDKEVLSKYKEYSIELAENKDARNKGKITPDVFLENDNAIKEKYQQEVGEENLKKGNELYNKESEENFKNTNPNYKKATKYQKEIDDLIRKKDNSKNSEKDKIEINKEINKLKSKQNASYANIRLDFNKQKIASLEKVLKNENVNSSKYKEALENKNNLIKSNKEINSGFKTTQSTTIDSYDPNSATTETTVDKEIYTKDFSNDFSDIIHSEKLVLNEIEYDVDYDNEYNDETINDDEVQVDPEGGDGQTDKPETVYDFTEEVARGDLEGNAPYIFGDDKEEEQSAKGFLKENPTAVLSAVLGIKGLADSQANIPSVGVEDKTALSASFYEYLNNLETISKKGFRPEEEAAYLKKINDGYMASVDLAVQASGGSRAQVLNQAGQLNANKNDALLNFSAQDAQLQRQNLEKYGQALEYKESFNERKDVRTQTNNYREKLADFEQAIQKREGGAALAASSINSLVTSIQDYKETGPGSALARYTEYMNKSLRARGTKINPETGKIFSNTQEWVDYNKKQNDIGTALNKAGIDFGRKFVNLADGTKEEKDFAAKKLKSLDRERQVSIMEQMNSNDEFGFKELSGLISDPTSKNPMDGIDASGIQMPNLTPEQPSIIDSAVSQFGVKRQANKIDEIDYNEFNNK